MNINNLKYLRNNPENLFSLIAGPCVIESEVITKSIAQVLAELTAKLSIPFIFKASYRKANRSSIDSFSGIGVEAGLAILQSIKEDLKIPVITDIHSAEDAILAASYNIDILQIPAFLCRQTDILEAAAKTGKHVNVKKGQFLSPEAMRFAVEKIEYFGNKNILLTERGVQFGYSDLVVDFTGIPTMQKFGYPVILDVTHSLQKPNQISGITGGKPEMIPTIAKAGIAVGADGLFIETHPSPSIAKSDGANMLKLSLMEDLLIDLIKIRKAIL